MRVQIKNLGLLAAFAALLVGTVSLSGCGSATNNDQGVSFTLLGFFADDVEAATACELPTQVTGITVPLATDANEAYGDSGRVRTTMGLQNNLSQQFIRTDRVMMEYYIAGASTQPPTTSLPLSTIINPAVSSETDGGAASAGFDSTLPPGFGNSGCSRGFAQFTLIPADIMTWINFNRADLPEAPFHMDVIVTVTGVSSAGDRFTSNPASMNVYMTPDVVIPADGTDDAGGSAAEPTAAPAE